MVLAMASKAGGASLQKLNITSSTLLSITDSSVSARGNCLLPSISVVTNEIVLDLYHFMCSHSECTYNNGFHVCLARNSLLIMHLPSTPLHRVSNVY